MEINFKEPPSRESLKELAKKYPEANPATILLIFSLFRVTSDLEKTFETYFLEYGLSIARFSVLMALYRSEHNRLMPSTIAEQLGVTRGNMTGLIDGLEEMGLISRHYDKSDRRSTLIQLSPKGLRLLEQVLPQHYKNLKSLFEKISSKDQEKLIETLNQLSIQIGEIK